MQGRTSGRRYERGRVATFAAAFAASVFAHPSVVPAGEAASESPASAAALAYERLPMAFEVNRGQADDAVLFLARGSGYRVELTAEAATISLRQSPPRGGSQADTAAKAAVVTLTFPGADAAARPIGEAPLTSTSNYFAGGRTLRAITGIPHYGRVRRAALYPGIDAVYYGNQGALEFDLVLAPGADPALIRLRFDGADAITEDADGNLLLHTAQGALVAHRPFVYQVSAAGRHAVDSRYDKIGDRVYGVSVASYDRDATLVIDPLLGYSTFLGGRRGSDAGTAIAVDTQGNAYIAGMTQASDFPLASAYDTRLGNADQDVFVAKLNPTGTALVYSTFLGGTKGADLATGVAVDGLGNVYVTGSTSGTDFPTTANAYQKAPASGGGAFVAKLGPSGNALIYSTYLLGASQTRIAVDAAGNAYVAGQANVSFATTTGAFQTAARSTAGGPFALALNASGSAARFATFLSGSGTDTAKAIALDTAGSVLVAGTTTSADFPVRNPLQPTRGGGADGFVSKLDPSGSALVFSTYLGGGLDDSINAIAIDRDGNVYAAGETYSGDFPTRNALQPNKAGQHLVNSSQGNAFVAKLGPAGNALLYSTFLGGELCYPYYCQSVFNVAQIAGDAAYGIAVDAQNHAFVTGLARSYTFPRVDSRLPAKQQDNQESLFVAKLSQGGHALLFSSLLYTGYAETGNGPNGAPTSAGQAIAIDVQGNAYLAKTGAPDFPTTAGTLQPSSAGGDSVVLKLAAAAGSLSLSTAISPAVANQPLTLTATGAATGTPVTFYDGRTYLGVAFPSGGAAVLTTTLAAGIHSLWASFNDGGNTGDSKPLLLVVNSSPLCE